MRNVEGARGDNSREPAVARILALASVALGIADATGLPVVRDLGDPAAYGTTSWDGARNRAQYGARVRFHDGTTATVEGTPIDDALLRYALASSVSRGHRDPNLTCCEAGVPGRTFVVGNIVTFVPTGMGAVPTVRDLSVGDHGDALRAELAELRAAAPKPKRTRKPSA